MSYINMWNTVKTYCIEANVKFLYSCIKASDELRLVDGQDTELKDIKIGEFELLICKDDNQKSLADFLIQIAENNGLLKKKDVAG